MDSKTETDISIHLRAIVSCMEDEIAVKKKIVSAIENLQFSLLLAAFVLGMLLLIKV